MSSLVRASDLWTRALSPSFQSATRLELPPRTPEEKRVLPPRLFLGSSWGSFWALPGLLWLSALFFLIVEPVSETRANLPVSMSSRIGHWSLSHDFSCYISKEERKVTRVVEAACTSAGTRDALPGPALHVLGLCRSWGAWSWSVIPPHKISR